MPERPSSDMLTGRPARYIRNALADDLIASVLPPFAFPAQMSVTAPLETGDRELTLLFAGQSAALGRDMSAGALVEAVMEEAGRRLRKLGRRQFLTVASIFRLQTKRHQCNARECP